MNFLSWSQLIVRVWPALLLCTLSTSEALAEVRLSNKELAAAADAIKAEQQCAELNKRSDDNTLLENFKSCKAAETKWAALMQHPSPIIQTMSMVHQADLTVRTARYNLFIADKFIEQKELKEANHQFNDACLRFKSSLFVRENLKEQQISAEAVKNELKKLNAFLEAKIGLNCDQLVKALH